MNGDMMSMVGAPKRAEMFGYLLATVVVLIILYFLLRKIGLVPKLFKPKAEREAAKTKTEVKAATKVIETTVNRSDYFNPSLWQGVTKSRLLPDETARENAEILRKAMKGLGTNESAINSVFRSLTDKIQVSQIAFFYLSAYSRDLASDLSKELTKKELQITYDIINNI